jgi:hypothetical protein
LSPQRPTIHQSLPEITPPNSKPEPVKESIRSSSRDYESNPSSTGVTRETSKERSSHSWMLFQSMLRWREDDTFSRDLQQEINENLRPGNSFVIARTKDGASTAILGRPRIDNTPRPVTAGPDKKHWGVRLSISCIPRHHRSESK